jgi:CubicO group peptidase (beta-lactamase class C family)
MGNFIRLSIAVVFVLGLLAFQKKDNGKLHTEIDHYASRISKRYGIPGMSIAIIKDGKVIYQKNHGKANIEHNVPVSDSSIFRIYSITKPIVGLAIFQLIEQGKIAVEDELGNYLDDLPTAWQGITLASLLRHTSGLPGMKNNERLPEAELKEKIYADSIHFEQGEQFEHTPTNHYLLSRVIEKVAGKPMEEFVLQNQFGENRQNGTAFFSTDSREIIPNRVTFYSPFNEEWKFMIDHPFGARYISGTNGLNLTMDAFIEWDTDFREGKLLSEAYKTSMFEAVKLKEDKRLWTYFGNERVVNKHISYGFSGSMTTVYRYFPKDNLSIIYLSNGFRTWYDVEHTINHLASLVDSDIVDYQVATFESLLETALSNLSEYASAYQSLAKNSKYEQVNLEFHTNNIGYILLNKLREIEKAIAVFTINTAQNPKSSNGFDSLAEAHEINGNVEKAIENYSKALKLSKDEKNNERLKLKLEELEELK